MAKDTASKQAEKAIDENLETDYVTPVALTNEEISFAHHLYSAEIARARQLADLEVRIAQMRDGYDPSAAKRLENQDRSLEDGAWAAEYARLWDNSAHNQVPLMSSGDQRVRAVSPEAAQASEGADLIQRITGRPLDEVDTTPLPNPKAAEKANEAAEQAEAEARKKEDK